MEKLSTIQKKKNLNAVFAADEKGTDGTNHIYEVQWDTDGKGTIGSQRIQFQDGARGNPESVFGMLDADLLEIVRHRFQNIQQSESASPEIAAALARLEEALMWLNKKAEDQAEQTVMARIMSSAAIKTG